jgi:hypothetical protein
MHLSEVRGKTMTDEQLAAMHRLLAVCTGNPVRVADVTESPKLAE